MIENAGEKKPALTIVIQSWATPIVGAVLLVIGLLGGYFGRPLIENGKQTTTRTAAPAVAQPTVATSNVSIPEFTSADELMDYLVSQAVHFKGDADAPVTMIEFSDFQ
jgi:hypothetical protein